jgi:hypothetical protein
LDPQTKSEEPLNAGTADRTRSASASRGEDRRGNSKRLAKLTGEGVETEGSWLRRAAAAAEAAEEE